MTTPMIDFRDLIEKSTDGDWLREMISFAAERLMDLEVEGLCGTGFGERSEERVNHRNGYRDRRWETRAGAVDLKIPKLRKSDMKHARLLVPGVATDKSEYANEPRSIARTRPAGYPILLRRSKGLVEYSLARSSLGKVMKARTSASAASMRAASFSTLGRRLSATWRHCRTAAS